VIDTKTKTKKSFWQNHSDHLWFKIVPFIVLLWVKNPVCSILLLTLITLLFSVRSKKTKTWCW